MVKLPGDLQALGLLEGGNWEGVAQGGPQHGGEAKPGSVLGEVASGKGISNAISLLAEVVELRNHGAREGLEYSNCFTGLCGFTASKGSGVARGVQHEEGGRVGDLCVKLPLPIFPMEGQQTPGAFISSQGAPCGPEATLPKLCVGLELLYNAGRAL